MVYEVVLMGFAITVSLEVFQLDVMGLGIVIGFM
jgi:hypothetical protein